MHTLVLAPIVDDRYGAGVVASRIGLKTDATIFDAKEDLLALVITCHREKNLSCVLVDCLLYTSPSPRDLSTSRMPSSA